MSPVKHVHLIGYSLPTPLPSVGWRRLNGDVEDHDDNEMKITIINMMTMIMRMMAPKAFSN